MGSDNPCGADNQQERLDAYKEQHPESSETICRTPSDKVVKIWSDLHGDMQSQAEMPWPSAGEGAGGGNNYVGPYPPCAQEP